MHPTLKRQLRKTLGEKWSISPDLQRLLDLIDASYQHADEDRELMERSLEISSKELLEKNVQLKEKIASLESGKTVISQLEKTTEALVAKNEKLEEFSKKIAGNEFKNFNLEQLVQQLSQHLTVKDYYALLAAINQTALVSVTDNKGIIIYANERFVEVSKYTISELIGRNHRILKSGHQSPALFDDLWKTISSGHNWRGEIKNRAKDGTFYWVDTSIAPIMDEAGKPERYVSIRFLVTEKKNLEEHGRLHVQELEDNKRAMLNLLEDIQEEKNKAAIYAQDLKKYKIALDGTSDHVIITDPEGVILYANKAIEHVTGFAPAEVIGKKAGTKDLWGGTMGISFYTKFWHTIKEEKHPFVGEFSNKRKDGTPYKALTSVSPILTKDGTAVEFFVGIERDITREKEVDKAKTEFVSLASHQLRTPLTSINWYIEMLQGADSGALTDKQREFLLEIYKASRRMVQLVNDLLNVSRLETGRLKIEPEPMDIAACIVDVRKELEPLIQKKLCHVELELPTHMDKVQADPMLLRQVITNLTTNAIRYAKGEGQGIVRISLVACPTSYVIQVKDNGIGVPKEAQEHIFEKFYRADNARAVDPDGNGLGLYLTKKIMEASGGTVTFITDLNLGTTFVVSIPLSGMMAKQGEKGLET